MEESTFCPIPLKDEEFYNFSSFVFDHFGINLTEAKRGLVSGRLHSVLKKHGFKSFGEFFDKMKADKDGLLLSELINRISTNFTYFYRESDHFLLLKDRILPDFSKTIGNKDLRIWCAGCSSGEEPYTLIMLLLDFFKLEYSQWKAGVLATDISEDMLIFARKGVYPFDRMKMLPKEWVRRYFKKVGAQDYRVVDDIQREVSFRRFNLMNKTYPFRSKFHVIFCRNVMIYFDQPTKEQLVKRFVEQLVPGGYLFIGHSETIGRNHPLLDYIGPSVYRRKL